MGHPLPIYYSGAAKKWDSHPAVIRERRGHMHARIHSPFWVDVRRTESNTVNAHEDLSSTMNKL